MVADLGLVTAQEAFAGIADLDPALLRVRRMNSSISRNWASVIRSVGSFLARPIGKIEKSRQWRTPSERSMSRKASSCGTIAPVTQVTTSYDSEGSRTIIRTASSARS